MCTKVNLHILICKLLLYIGYIHFIIFLPHNFKSYKSLHHRDGPQHFNPCSMAGEVIIPKFWLLRAK